MTIPRRQVVDYDADGNMRSDVWAEADPNIHFPELPALVERIAGGAYGVPDDDASRPGNGADDGDGNGEADGNRATADCGVGPGVAGEFERRRTAMDLTLLLRQDPGRGAGDRRGVPGCHQQ